MAPLRRRPFWWHWELELSSHVERRMARRHFDELSLRRMLEHAERVRRDHVEGRVVVEARHIRTRWEIIVEPDIERECVRVVTAYPVDAE